MYSKWLKNVNSKKVIESGHKLQQKASTLGISRGTVSDVIVRFQRREQKKMNHKPAVVVCLTRETEGCLFDKFRVTVRPH